MAQQFDDAFYDRAAAHIDLSNDQLSGETRDMVNASMLFASARFSAWVAACGFDSGQAMGARRGELMEFFVNRFRQMLEGNLEAYINNFDEQMKPNK